MIKLQNVTKQFEGAVTAVDDISFEVGEGETFGLIGTSGCGKTTTLKMINRLMEPTGGEILLNGQSIINQPVEKLRRNIGYVIQSVGLFPHYTIKENISVVPKLLRWEQQKISERSNELLELVGLEPGQYAGRKPDALSGGQQQRVGLARALAGDPEVLLMDEPFGALDPITKENIRGEFKKLLEELQKTVIFVTHDVFEAFDLCDRICVMDQGKARQIGPPRELLFQPANAFVRSFFDAHRFQLEMMSITIGDILEVEKGNSGLPGTSEALRNFSKEEEKGLDTSRSEANQGKHQSSPSHPAHEDSEDKAKENRFDAAKSGENQKDDLSVDPGDSRIKGRGQTISFSDSFFSVFENASRKNEDYDVLNEEGESVAIITADELLKGFQSVRANLKEGWHD